MRIFEKPPVLQLLLAALLSCLSVFLSAQDRTIRMVFAGDLMAHLPNFSIEPYDAMYEKISYILKSADLNFVNLEFPVDDTAPYASYPTFNVHSEYPFSAIKAGFDVFSLANNHSADRGSKGVAETVKAMSALQQRAIVDLDRPIWFNGLRPSINSAPYTLTVIEKFGLKIGFVAIAEWVNIPSLKKWVQYADFREKPSPENFVAWLHLIRKKVDVLVLSYHWGEEYINKQNDARARFSKLLVEAGVDVIWGNHPHVLQPWYTLESNRGSALVLPSCGNFISGQTWFLGSGDSLKADAPKGDSMLMVLSISVSADGKIHFLSIEPILIASWKNTKGQMIVRTMADLVRNTEGSWRNYFQTRLTNMSTLIPQSREPSAFLGLMEPIPDRNIPY